MVRLPGWLAATLPLCAQFDLVILGGRVLDPETNLDGVRNIGVTNGKIAAVTPRSITGKRTIDARGLAVAPGFIDLHSHGIDNASNEYQAHDGVTTALELELGVYDVQKYLDQRKGKALLNYGTTASHPATRMLAMKELAAKTAVWSGENDLQRGVKEQGRELPLRDEEEYSKMTFLLEQALKQGALGLGVMPAYTPGSSRNEIFRVYQLAARWKVPIFTHVRGWAEEGVQEAIANAAGTGAAVHVVHLNSSTRSAIPNMLELIAGARARGIDITTEAYPYTAGSTFLESALFEDGWQETLGIDYGDLQWQATGERLTKESFQRYRKQGGVVILHLMKPEWIRTAMSSPFVIIASDTMPYAKGAHPRGGGTFSKVLAEYVRETKAAPLMEAIRRMTLLPAQRLEAIAPAMKQKGRIRVGADADLTLFDPATVKDTGTYQTGPQFARGIPYVIVNGVPVVEDGKTAINVFPGRPVLGNYGRRLAPGRPGM
ncbi:MAG: amidohydrolase family protein [Acidobacteria bacterium]|nr:amidohydrolase family protein [Acidobacteriota bacterium]